MKTRMQKVLQPLVVALSVLLMTSTFSLAEVTFDQAAIEAEIAAAAAVVDDPTLAAKIAIANAVIAVAAANQDYPGGADALNFDILDAVGDLTIPGLDPTDAQIAANHALGIIVDPFLEAYEDPRNSGLQDNIGTRSSRQMVSAPSAASPI